MKILIIRLSSIGDIFHAFTVIPDIKRKFPNAEIDWLVDENFIGIAKLSPLIDNIISIPLRKWKKNKLTWLLNVFKFKKQLSNKKYDFIIDTQALIKTALLNKILFNGLVYGLDRKSAREPLASCFYDFSYNVDQNNIAIVRLRSLIAKIFNLDINLAKFEFNALTRPCNINYPNGYILLLHGTSRIDKQWSLANWLYLARWIIANSKQQILVTYSNESEYIFCQELVDELKSDRISIVEKLQFAELSDLIVNSKLVVGVDTGFTHYANLVNRPTIAIYLDSIPQYGGIMESSIAKNFGGKQQQVDPHQIIEYIQQKNFLE